MSANIFQKKISLTKKGFSLVELSIVLAIMGITLAGGLTVATQNTQNEKRTTTTNRLDAIETALARYTLDTGGAGASGYLPCPSDIDLPLSDANFGLSQTSGANCVNGNYGSPTSSVYAGGVPVRALNLPDEYANDGFGRRILYVVHNSFAEGAKTFQATPAGTIFVGTTPGASDLTAIGVYALVSFGLNGHGAYGRNGGSSLVTFGSTDTSEQENCDCDSTPTVAEFTGFDKQFVKKSETDTFDDVVRYKVKSDVISDANGVTDTTLCTDASPANKATTCSGATNDANCQAMAGRIYGWCLQ